MSGLKNSLNTNTTTVPVYPIKSSVTIKNPTFPLMRKAGDETLEEQRLKAEVNSIERQTLEEQPRHGWQLQPIVIEGHESQGRCAARHKHQQQAQHLYITPHRGHQPEKQQDNQCHHRIYLGKCPRRQPHRLHIQNLHQEVLLDVLQDGE